MYMHVCVYLGIARDAYVWRHTQQFKHMWCVAGSLLSIALTVNKLSVRPWICFRADHHWSSIKPVKQGIKVWCRSDLQNGYICEFQPCTGWKESGKKEINLGGRVVLNLSQRKWMVSHLLWQLFHFCHAALQPFVSRLVCLWYSTTGLQRLPCCPTNEGERKGGWGWISGRYECMFLSYKYITYLSLNVIYCFFSGVCNSTLVQAGNIVTTLWLDNYVVRLLATNSWPKDTTQVLRP